MSAKYREVSQILEMKIYEGEFPYSTKLPTEDEMIETFGVSRNTVRKAVEILVQKGLVMPVQGSGIFVRWTSDQGITSLEGFQGMTLGFSRSNIRSEVVEFELIEADEEIAKNMNCEIGTPVYYIERVRHLDGKPYVYEYSYYNKNVIPYLSVEIISKSIYSYITRDLNKQLGYVHRVIYADKLTKKQAEYFGLEEGDPALITTNTAMLKSGVVFDYSVDVHHYQNTKFLKLSNIM